MAGRQTYTGGRSSSGGRTTYTGNRGSSGGRSTYTGDSPPVVAKPAVHHGGLFSDVLKGLEKPGHVVEHLGEDTASTLKNLPGGVYKLGKAVWQANHGNSKPLHDVAVGTAKQYKDYYGHDVFHHMYEHPLQPLLDGLTIVSGGAGAAARVGEASKAATFSDSLKALAVKAPMKPRLITVGEKEIPLQPSKNSAVRAAQGMHDRVIQKAITKNPSGRIASRGTKKLGKSLSETRNYQMNMQSAPAAQLEREGSKLRGDKQAQRAALRLTAENTTPDEVIATSKAQIEKGVNSKGHQHQIGLMERVKKGGFVKQDEHGHVVIDALKHPKLASVDLRIAHGISSREQILRDTGQMTEEGMKSRTDRPNQVRATGEAVSPDAMKQEAQGQMSMLTQPTRPGRTYVPYYASETRASKMGIASAPNPVVGKVKGIVSKNKPFKGDAILSGNVPGNPAKLVAAQMRRAYKFANSDSFRRSIVKAGSDTRKSNRDVLVNTQELKNARVPEEIHTMLGNRTSTLEDVAGHVTAFDAWRERIFPGVGTKFMEENRQGLGTPAPEGYRWVDKNLLGDLASPIRVGEKSKVAKTMDNINAAVTAATVYFKPGHVATRAGTNAMTNIIQGSATPVGIGKSVRLWHGLSHEDKTRALGAAGQGGIASMPAEAANAVGKTAHVGAMWWSKNVDAPFRFNSIAFEARKAGIKTPDQFKKFLDDLQHPDKLTPEEHARVDGIAKRADREAIAYDRLSEAEKNIMRRAVWFYPWVKGSTMFAGNTLLEHPFKSALIGQAGRIGEEQSKKDFGDLPGYEQGLFKVGGSPNLPLTVNPATLSPFGTPAEVTESLMHLNKPTESQQLSSYLNPAAAAAIGAAFHLDSFGGVSKTGVLNQIMTSLASTTPEASLAQALSADKKKNGKRMFPVSSEEALLKFLFGSATPRQMNRAVANSAARKEKLNAGIKP